MDKLGERERKIGGLELRSTVEAENGTTALLYTCKTRGDDTLPIIIRSNRYYINKTKLHYMKENAGIRLVLATVVFI